MRFLILFSPILWGVAVSEWTDYPQVVVLGFDDAIDQTLYDYFYAPLFNLTNPDQCTVGLTFFVSHDYTDYTLAHDLWQRGHEIASGSISHPTPSINQDYQGYIDEMYGMKEIASNFACIPMEDIKGARAPYYQVPNYADYLSALHDTNFSYDSTWSTTVDPPLYPFPFTNYPGLWEFPINACSLIDSCGVGVTGTNETFEYLLSIFNHYYEVGRTPLQMSTHASWFQTDPTLYQGYLMFLDYLGTLDDVYVVTMAKALEWVKNPTKLVDLPDFKPWDCVQPRSGCQPVTCHYESTPPGGARLMNSCVSCPPNYPWLKDPYGNNTGV